MPDLDEIQRDLACPKCEYNLRGLRGAIVDCPECGHSCDIAQMITQRWTQPWYQAPGLQKLYGPTAWAVLYGLFAMPCFLSSASDNIQRMAFVTLLFGVWSVALGRCWFVFNSSEGIRFALFSHLIFAAYILGVLPFLVAFLAVVVGLFGRESPAEMLWLFIISICLMIPGALLLRLGHRWERGIAEKCIRNHLNKAPKS